jgi:cytochrome P450
MTSKARAGPAETSGHAPAADPVVIRGPGVARVLAHYFIDPITCVTRYSNRYPGRPIRIDPPWRARRDRGGRVLLLTGPTYNRQVLLAGERLRPTGMWPVQGPPGSAHHALRRNYLVSHGPDHARISTAIAPHLERQRVNSHFPAVRRIATEEIAGWPIGEVIDVSGRLRDLSQSYAFTLLFGEADQAVVRHFGAMIAGYHAANWSRAAALLRLDLPLLPYRDLLRRADRLMAFLEHWLDKSAGCPADGNMRAMFLAQSGRANGAEGCPRHDGTAGTMAAAHFASVAVASYETTATTLTWALLLLACHPEIAVRLAEEVAAAGPLEDMADAEGLLAMPLLDGVIKETMRLITPVPVLGFRTLRDGNLAGFDLAAETNVVISPHLTHRMAAIYPEPDRFVPQRWASIRPSAFEYLPFSGGPRRCPGFHFAQTNLRMALCAIISRFRVEIPAGARIDRRYAAITVPRTRVPLRLVAQDGRQSAVPRCRGSIFDLFRM